MPLVWITGTSGSGKSAVVSELSRRGCAGYDADDDRITVWRNRTTGELVPFRRGRWPNHAWEIERPRVEELAAAAEGRTVFLCGSVENESDVWDLFTVVICLVIDEQTLRARLAQRTSNDFGKTPEELEAILEWNKTVESACRSFGATIIDASQPLERVVDLVLAVASDSR